MKLIGQHLRLLQKVQVLLRKAWNAVVLQLLKDIVLEFLSGRSSGALDLSRFDLRGGLKCSDDLAIEKLGQELVDVLRGTRGILLPGRGKFLKQ